VRSSSQEFPFREAWEGRAVYSISWSWQFSGAEALDEAHVPFFGAFGAAWDGAMIAGSSSDPLGVLRREVDAAL
jgi:hypothetical protein